MAKKKEKKELELFSKKTRVPREPKQRRLPRTLPRLASGNFRGGRAPDVSSPAQHSTRPKSKDGKESFHFALTKVTKGPKHSQIKTFAPGTAAAHVDYIERPLATEEVHAKDPTAASGRISQEAMPLWPVVVGPISFGNTGATLAERIEFWLRLEEAERSNARVQNRLIVELPCEISAAGRREILERFVIAAIESKDLGYWAVVHQPDLHNDPRNFHGHIIFTDRPVARLADGTWDFSYTGKPQNRNKNRFTRPKMQKKNRSMSGLRCKTWIREMRGLYAECANLVLEKEGHKKRYDPRTYEEMGIPKKPTEHLGTRKAALESQGASTEVGISNAKIEREFAMALARTEAEATITDLLTQMQAGADPNFNSASVFADHQTDFKWKLTAKMFLAAAMAKAQSWLDFDQRMIRIKRFSDFISRELEEKSREGEYSAARVKNLENQQAGLEPKRDAARKLQIADKEQAIYFEKHAAEALEWLKDFVSKSRQHQPQSASGKQVSETQVNTENIPVRGDGISAQQGAIVNQIDAPLRQDASEIAIASATTAIGTPTTSTMFTKRIVERYRSAEYLKSVLCANLGYFHLAIPAVPFPEGDAREKRLIEALKELPVEDFKKVWTWVKEAVGAENAEIVHALDAQIWLQKHLGTRALSLKLKLLVDEKDIRPAVSDEKVSPTAGPAQPMESAYSDAAKSLMGDDAARSIPAPEPSIAVDTPAEGANSIAHAKDLQNFVGVWQNAGTSYERSPSLYPPAQPVLSGLLSSEPNKVDHDDSNKESIEIETVTIAAGHQTRQNEDLLATDQLPLKAPEQEIDPLPTARASKPEVNSNTIPINEPRKEDPKKGEILRIVIRGKFISAAGLLNELKVDYLSNEIVIPGKQLWSGDSREKATIAALGKLSDEDFRKIWAWAHSAPSAANAKERSDAEELKYDVVGAQVWLQQNLGDRAAKLKLEPLIALEKSTSAKDLAKASSPLAESSTNSARPHSITALPSDQTESALSVRSGGKIAGNNIAGNNAEEKNASANAKLPTAAGAKPNLEVGSKQSSAALQSTQPVRSGVAPSRPTTSGTSPAPGIEPAPSSGEQSLNSGVASKQSTPKQSEKSAAAPLPLASGGSNGIKDILQVEDGHYAAPSTSEASAKNKNGHGLSETDHTQQTATDGLSISLENQGVGHPQPGAINDKQSLALDLKTTNSGGTDSSSILNADPVTEIFLSNEKYAEKLVSQIREGKNIIGLIPLNGDIETDKIKAVLSQGLADTDLKGMYQRTKARLVNLDNYKAMNTGAAIIKDKKMDSTEITRRLLGELMVERALEPKETIFADRRALMSTDGQALPKKNQCDPCDHIENLQKNTGRSRYIHGS